jgi:acyl-CoA thioesterase
MRGVFDTDTALERLDPTQFAGTISRRWWIERAPNGGYVAAILLRSLISTLNDPARSPRSLTVHYLDPLQEGPCEVHTAVERSGRALATLSARITQNGRSCAAALSAFSASREGMEFSDLAMPDVPGPAVSRPWSVADGPAVPIIERWEARIAAGGGPFAGTPEASVAVWMRLPEPHLTDALVASALTDAWFPPIYSRATEPVATPTIDLNIHFRATLPLPSATAESWTLGVFHSRLATEGFAEVDGELWSEDGVLIAQSRQLSLCLLLRK